jgi:hypothetical protein
MNNYYQQGPMAPQQPMQQQQQPGMQPMQPMQQQQPPMYQQPGMQPMQPMQQPGMVNPQAMQQQTTGVAQQFMVDPEAAKAALQQEEQSESSGNRGPAPNYIKVLGPAGQTRWDASVPVNYTGELPVWICGPWKGGVSVPYLVSDTHFFKSGKYPRGKVISCTGDDTCLFCQARSEGLKSPDPTINQIATNWGKKRRQFLYNAFDLQNPANHYYQDGLMRPSILAASKPLQDSLRNLFMAREVGNITDYQQGRPIKLIKKKSGPEDVNVTWDAIDLNPEPLNQYFWPGTHNLWNLDEIARQNTSEEIIAAIQDVGLPMPGGTTPHVQVPAGYDAFSMQHMPANNMGASLPPAPISSYPSMAQSMMAGAQQFSPMQSTPPQQLAAPPINTQQQAPGMSPPPPPATYGAPMAAPPPPATHGAPMTPPAGQQVPPPPPGAPQAASPVPGAGQVPPPPPPPGAQGNF